MGLTNDVGTKEDIKCIKCNKSLRYNTTHPVLKDTIFFQSKDLLDRGHKWMVGDKIILQSHESLKFIAEGNDIWSGCIGCPHCRTFLDAEIIIKDGIITEIKNLMVYK